MSADAEIFGENPKMSLPVSRSSPGAAVRCYRTEGARSCVASHAERRGYRIVPTFGRGREREDDGPGAAAGVAASPLGGARRGGVGGTAGPRLGCAPLREGGMRAEEPAAFPPRGPNVGEGVTPNARP